MLDDRPELENGALADAAQVLHPSSAFGTFSPHGGEKADGHLPVAVVRRRGASVVFHAGGVS